MKKMIAKADPLKNKSQLSVSKTCSLAQASSLPKISIEKARLNLNLEKSPKTSLLSNANAETKQDSSSHVNTPS